MKIRLYADIEVTEEAESVVLATAQLKAEANGNAPDTIDTVGDALVELFELTDEDGKVFDPRGVTLLTIDTISDIEKAYSDAL